MTQMSTRMPIPVAVMNSPSERTPLCRYQCSASLFCPENKRTGKRSLVLLASDDRHRHLLPVPCFMLHACRYVSHRCIHDVTVESLNGFSKQTHPIIPAARFMSPLRDVEMIALFRSGTLQPISDSLRIHPNSEESDVSQSTIMISAHDGPWHSSWDCSKTGQKYGLLWVVTGYPQRDRKRANISSMTDSLSITIILGFCVSIALYSGS